MSPFPQKLPDNLKLNKQVTTTISTDDFERWFLICQRKGKCGHELLREVVRDYIRVECEKMNSRPLPVIEALRK